MAPTLVAARTALPPEGAGLARGGPALRPVTPTLVAARTRIKLNSIRIGDVKVYEIDAIVTPQAMPFNAAGQQFPDSLSDAACLKTTR